MYADRYAPKPLDRASLTLSVGIVGGLVAAAVLSPTVIRIVDHRPDLKTYIVPPPPPKPEALQKPQAKAKPSITPRQTLVETPQPPKVAWTPPPEQPFTGGPSAGDDAGPATVIEPPKPPPPVVTGTEIDPRYARDFQPLYPPAEQRAGRDGVVTLKVLVGIDGRVVRAEQIMATSDEFWRVTLKQALAKWRFRPATRDGAPFESWRTMTVRFRLDEQ